MTASPRRWTACLAAAVVALAVTPGCGGDDSGQRRPPGVVSLPSPAVPDGPSVRVDPPGDDSVEVIVVGDSITLASADAIKSRLGELGYVVVVDAEEGRRIDGGSAIAPGTARVSAFRGTYAEPDLWVVALGTNDVPGYESGDDYRRLIDTMLAEIPPTVPLIWVNVYLDDDVEGAQRFNGVLLEALTARGNARVANWEALASGDGVLSDGVHPTVDVGVPAFSGLVADAVADWPL